MQYVESKDFSFYLLIQMGVDEALGNFQVIAKLSLQAKKDQLKVKI
jgi:hypothetical protein